jgi:hypothetical protein
MCPSAYVLLFSRSQTHIASGRAAKRRRVKPMLSAVPRVAHNASNSRMPIVSGSATASNNVWRIARDGDGALATRELRELLGVSQTVHVQLAQ